MATILDVAKKAGVSQGTVSNVLNGKGNVSSEKIRAVEEAARALGYTINERAKILRKGSGNVICVILPTMEFKQYRELYNSIKYYAEQRGVSTELLISNDNYQTELELVHHAQSVMALGVATVSCLKQEENPYKIAGLQKVCFVERKPLFEADYYGFNYRKAGWQLAEMILGKDYRNVTVVTGLGRYSNETELLQGFKAAIDENTGAGCAVDYISIDMLRLPHVVLDLVASGRTVDCIVTTNAGYAEKIKELLKAFIFNADIDIFTLSPMKSLPDYTFINYELNYAQLGKEVAQKIIETGKQEFSLEDHVFENDGIRGWGNIAKKTDRAATINMLTLEGPEAVIIQGLARLYTEQTGTNVKVAIFSYEDMYSQFLNAEVLDMYDIIRSDVTWLSWFADRLLIPLEEVDPGIGETLNDYIPSLIDKYAYVRGKIYALPITPSAQLLFYRKDLFENAVIKRIYREKYKEELRIPDTFEKYNQVARFFSELNIVENDVKHGTNITLGNAGLAFTEFLTRFFSHKNHLYEPDGRVVIDNEQGRMALYELMEAQKYSPLKESRWWTTSAKDFSNGDIAMMITFSNYASEIFGSQSKIVDKVGCAMVPGGNPIYGGGALGIPRNSRHKEEALSFLKWLTHEPASSAMASLGSVSPCRKTYERYDIIRAFPWLELSKDCFELSKTKRIKDDHIRAFDEKTLINIIGPAVKEALMGITEAEDALKRAQKLIDIEFN